MQLPNYFLADLPEGAPLNPEMLREAALTLKRNRNQYLTARPTRSIIQVVHQLARSWRNPEDPFRQQALASGPAATGFPPHTLARGLDAFFSELTGEKIEALLEQDLGSVLALDQFVPSNRSQDSGRSALARGPALLMHITAGNVVSPTLLSMVHGLLVRSAQFVKCATGTSLLPRLFAHSLYAMEPKLGACLEIAEWPGGSHELEEALFAEADCVTATGSDETIQAVRNRLPAHLRFAGYGHRLSFGYLTRESLSGYDGEDLAAQAVEDVIAWNQLGCLSPHVFYAESGGRISPEQFAELLARELENRERLEPRGAIPSEDAAAISARRSFYDVRAAFSPDTQKWASPDSTAWTVIYETDPRFQVSCLNRFVYVKTVAHPEEALHAAELVRGKVSTVGLAAPANRAEPLARQFAVWGATRVCPIGSMQKPPLLWRHDGRPALGELVTWTDWER